MGKDKRLKSFVWDFIKDVLVPVIMGVCSVIVAVSANRIAKSANDTAELQALIAKNAEAPTIEIVNGLGGDELEASISISILDGKYSNFDSDPVSFLSFTFSGEDTNGHWSTLSRVDIPISYFSFGHGSQTLYGEIWEWESAYTMIVDQFRDDCKDYYMEKHQIEPDTRDENRIDVSVITCLKCTYWNLLEEEESIYYFIGPSGLCDQISQEQGNAWFQKNEDMNEASFFLYFDWMEKHDAEAAFDLIDRIKKDGKQYLGTESLY